MLSVDGVMSEHGPDEKTLASIKMWLKRLHDAAGHPSNTNLAKLLSDRGYPKWLIDEARKLHCQVCLDLQRGEHLRVPVSVNQKIVPWEVVGLDCFEVFYPSLKIKVRWLLMVDVCTRFMAVSECKRVDQSMGGGPILESSSRRASRGTGCSIGRSPSGSSWTSNAVSPWASSRSSASWRVSGFSPSLARPTGCTVRRSPWWA